MKKLFTILAALIFLVGAACIIIPMVFAEVNEQEIKKDAEEFSTDHKIRKIDSADELSVETEGEVQKPVAAEADDLASEPERENAELYSAIQAYNLKIYEEGQSGLCDAWSYTQAGFDLSAYGYDDGIFGYIEIPSMDSVMPIYLGASEENMAKGAVVLGQTSIPIGGDNTNSVIACHRGWYRQAFWRDIENISVGDAVYVTNLWEKLTYTVESIEIIQPNEIDKVLIQDGRDMLTLATCHPYGGHGIYRYVVHCVRSEAGETANVQEASYVDVSDEQTQFTELPKQEAESQSSGTDVEASEGITFESSAQQIQAEQHAEATGVVLVVCIAIVLLAKILVGLG